MNRTDLQLLAEERVLDAEALLNAGRWSGAYYLAGYAVECGLKACIAKQTQQHDFPDKDRTLKSFTHDIGTLVFVAELVNDLKAELAANPVFVNLWLAVKDWNERARYTTWTELEARQLFDAVTDPTNGVMRWLKAHW